MKKYNVPNLFRFFNTIPNSKMPNEFTLLERDILLTQVVNVIHCQNNGLDGLDKVFQKIKRIFKETEKHRTVQRIVDTMILSHTENLKRLFTHVNSDLEHVLPPAELSSTEQDLILLLLIELAHLPNVGDKQLQGYLYDIRVIYKVTREKQKKEFSNKKREVDALL